MIRSSGDIEADALKKELAEAKDLLIEAIQWFECPIRTQEDVVYFLDFESRVLKFIEKDKVNSLDELTKDFS